MRSFARRLVLAGCVGLLVVAAAAVGCKHAERPVPLPPGVDPGDVHDVDAPSVPSDTATLKKLLTRKYSQYREDQKKNPADALPGRGKSVLILSGGSADGAYQAGVLVGMTRTKTRPDFDVVCGVSTGALVGALASLGPEADCDLQRFYTTTTNDDVLLIGGLLDRGVTLRGLIQVGRNAARVGGLGDSSPLEAQVRGFVTPDYLARVAARYAAGKRFYVGTTNLDTKRFVVWDMGAIASRCTPEATELYVKVILASCSIPAIFPPVRIPVTIDGQSFEELHVDGGTVRRMFFRAPTVPGTRAAMRVQDLAGADVFVIVAGKVHGDPVGTVPGPLGVGFRSLSTQLEANARVEMFRMYTYALEARMNPHFSSLPEDFPDSSGLVGFDPDEMTRMFTAGFDRVVHPTPELPAWEEFPPELTPQQEFSVRTWTTLTSAPPPPPQRDDVSPHQPKKPRPPAPRTKPVPALRGV